jgi:hypothetical protein
MKFTKTHNDWNGNFLETISMEMREDADIDDVLETFSRFLRAVGYHFVGEVQIVDPDEINLDYNAQEPWDFGADKDKDAYAMHIYGNTPAFEGPVEGFNDNIQLDDDSTDLPTGWPFPTKSKP